MTVKNLKLNNNSVFEHVCSAWRRRTGALLHMNTSSEHLSHTDGTLHFISDEQHHGCELISSCDGQDRLEHASVSRDAIEH